MRTNVVRCLAMMAMGSVPSLLAYEDGPRIAWDFQTARKLNDGVYSRVKPIGEGKWAIVYSEGPGVQIRISSDKGKTWGKQITVASETGYNNTNSELIRLANGWLLYAWNGRPQDKTNLPFVIKTRISKDNGLTWSAADQRLLYTADANFENGCWEPAMLQLPSGEILLFFANENPYRTSWHQDISLMRSKDNGLSWTGPTKASFREPGRDGMPVPVRLQNGKGLALAIEDPGFNGTFKPVIVWSSEADNWNSTVPGDSPNRWGALRADHALPGPTYAGAPYLIQMPGGETILSIQSTEGRADPNNPIAQFYIGDGDAKNFAKKSTPFPWVPQTGNANWNAMHAMDSNTILATSSISGIADAGIWTIEGRLVRPEMVRRGSVVVDGIVDAGQASTPANLFVGSLSRSRLNLRTAWDDANLYLSFQVHDEKLWGDTATHPWDDDGVEVYLDPRNKSCKGVCEGLYKALVNIDGTTLFDKGSATGWSAWSPTVKSKIKTTGTLSNNADVDQGYVIELAIPWVDMGGRPATGAGFGLQVKHHDDANGATAETHESLSGGSPDDASSYLKAYLDGSEWTASVGAKPASVPPRRTGTRDLLGRLPSTEAESILSKALLR